METGELESLVGGAGALHTRSWSLRIRICEMEVILPADQRGPI